MRMATHTNLCFNTLCNYERHVAHFPMHTGNHMCHNTELVVDTWWNALYYLVTPEKVHTLYRPSEVCYQLFFSMLFSVGSWYLMECTLLYFVTPEKAHSFSLDADLLKYVISYFLIYAVFLVSDDFLTRCLDFCTTMANLFFCFSLLWKDIDYREKAIAFSVLHHNNFSIFMFSIFECKSKIFLRICPFDLHLFVFIWR